MKDEGRINQRRWMSLAASFALVAACGFAGADAAELHLRREAASGGSLVTLGDVAEIYSNDEAEKSQLARIELFAAPAEGQTRIVRLREIQDVLAQRGVDLRTVRMSGASAVSIQSQLPQSAAPATVGQADRQQVLTARIVEYLGSMETGVDWQVSVNITGDLTRALAAGESIVGIGGGREPWVGSQRFSVMVSDGQATRELPLIANVERPFAVVVPVRPLVRGEVVQASDLQLQTVATAANNVNSLSSISHAVGQEVTRSVPAGRPLQQSDVRPAVLVGKNDIVTVFVRSPGVQVRTSAKSLEDGAENDVIKLQSLNDRDEHFVARVTAFKEVEILAGSPRIEAPPRDETPSPSNTNSPANSNRLGTTQRPSLFGLRVLNDED